MSLYINLSYPGTTGVASGSYTLKAEQVVHTFIRLPVQAPLPSDNDLDPNIFSLDLGMCREEIAVKGLVDSTGAGSLPSKSNLETVGRNWWDYGDTVTALPLLTLSAGNAYYGHIKNLDFTWEGALEDRWSFTLVFLVREKQGV